MRMPPLSTPVSSSIVAIILSSIRGTCDQYWEVGFSPAIGRSLLARLSILIRPTNDNLRVARDPPGIGIRQPLFAFPRHSFGEVIQIDMAS
jgi:hypothetical protein